MELQFLYNKVYLFSVYSSMNFGKLSSFDKSVMS